MVAGDGAMIGFPRSAERCVLGAFALSPNRRLSVDDLISHVWDEEPPGQADETLATYVRSVRRALTRAGAPPGTLRSHRPRMYSLDVDPLTVDYHNFRSLCAAAHDAAVRSDPASAARQYRSALDTWTGPALTGVTTQWADRRRHALGQERVETVYRLCQQLELTGAHQDAMTLIEQLAEDTVPTDRLLLLGVETLRSAGQRAAIPDFVQRLTQRMIQAVGVGPSSSVREAARQAATKDHEAETPPHAGVEVARSGTGDPPANRGVSLYATNSRRVHQAAGRITIFKRSDS